MGGIILLLLALYLLGTLLNYVSQRILASVSQEVSLELREHIAGAFAMLMSISVELTLIALGTVGVSIVVAAVVGMRTNRYYAKNQAALGALNANIEEAFTGNRVVKAFNMQDIIIAANDTFNENLRKTSMKAQFFTYAINPLVRFLGHIGYVAIAVRGAMSVISGNISIGDVQEAFQYVNQISEPITQLSYTWNTLQGRACGLNDHSWMNDV